MSSLHPEEGLIKSPSLRHGTATANWLQSERFEDPKFSAEACIADFRRYVSFVSLKVVPLVDVSALKQQANVPAGSLGYHQRRTANMHRQCQKSGGHIHPFPFILFRLGNLSHNSCNEGMCSWWKCSTKTMGNM
jgi:hypothetical protein